MGEQHRLAPNCVAMMLLRLRCTLFKGLSRCIFTLGAAVDALARDLVIRKERSIEASSLLFFVVILSEALSEPSAPLCHSERSEESRIFLDAEGPRLRFKARAAETLRSDFAAT